MASHKSIWKTRVSHPTNWAAWGTFRLGELQESALSPPKDNNADVRTFTHVCASLQVCLILFLWQEDTANPRQVGPPTRKRAATEPNKRETEMMTSRFVSSDKDINTSFDLDDLFAELSLVEPEDRMARLDAGLAKYCQNGKHCKKHIKEKGICLSDCKPYGTDLKQVSRMDTNKLVRERDTKHLPHVKKCLVFLG
ncbi:hypothetical protein ABBQ32_012199 [Trebouxia sp. C0010 RCD-2024]